MENRLYICCYRLSHVCKECTPSKGTVVTESRVGQGGRFSDPLDETITTDDEQEFSPERLAASAGGYTRCPDKLQGKVAGAIPSAGWPALNPGHTISPAKRGKPIPGHDISPSKKCKLDFGASFRPRNGANRFPGTIFRP